MSKKMRKPDFIKKVEIANGSKEKQEKIVRIAMAKLREFVKEWKANPYLWWSEADVQAELYIRIKTALKKEKFFSVKFKSKNMEHENNFTRIYCTPPTYAGGEKYFRPDIAIYKSLKSDEGNDPDMLWVCEIKYGNESRGYLDDEKLKSDHEKLKELFKKKKADYACCLILERIDFGIYGKHKVLRGDPKPGGKYMRFLKEIDRPQVDHCRAVIIEKSKRNPNWRVQPFINDK